MPRAAEAQELFRYLSDNDHRSRRSKSKERERGNKKPMKEGDNGDCHFYPRCGQARGELSDGESALKIEGFKSRATASKHEGGF